MGFACNIDRRGRRARAVCGALFIAVAIALVWLRWPVSEWLRWTLAGAAGMLGSFQIFEASVGWCVVRAMGRKTPI